MLAAVVPQGRDLLVNVRHWLAEDHAADVLGAERIFARGLLAGKTHADKRDGLGIFLADIFRDRRRVHKAAGDDLIGVEGVGNALRARAGGVDNTLAADGTPLEGVGRVAEVKSRANGAAALTDQHRRGVFFAPCERVVQRADGAQLRRVHGSQIALQRKCAEDVDHNGQTARLLRAFQQLQNLYVHKTSPHFLSIFIVAVFRGESNIPAQRFH